MEHPNAALMQEVDEPLSGAAQAWVLGAAAAVILVLALRSLSMSPAGYRPEPPLQPEELVGRW